MPHQGPSRVLPNAREAIIARFGRGGDEIDVVGLASCSVELGRESADQLHADPQAHRPVGSATRGIPASQPDPRATYLASGGLCVLDTVRM
jgi:hypothetical protein